MRLTSLVGTIIAACLVTGLIIYGAIFVLPKIANSAPQENVAAAPQIPRYSFSIGSSEGLLRPNAVAVDRDGLIYVTDGATGKISVFSTKGKKLRSFGERGSGKSQFNFPNGIIVDKYNNVLVSDSVNRDIKVFNQDGKYLRTIFKSSEVKPGLLTYDGNNLIYVSDLSGNKVLAITEEGKLQKMFFDKNKSLKYPQETAIDSKGRLWVTDAGNYTIKIFNKQGMLEKELSGGGTPSSDFSLVRGVAIDPSGKMIVSDTLAHKLRSFETFDQSENLTYLNATGKDSEFDSLVFPTNIFINKKGNYYVVDRGSSSVKVFSKVSKVSK